MYDDAALREVIAELERAIPAFDRRDVRPKEYPPEWSNAAVESMAHANVIAQPGEAFVTPLRVADVFALIRYLISQARLVDAADVLHALEQWSRRTAALLGAPSQPPRGSDKPN